MDYFTSTILELNIKNLNKLYDLMLLYTISSLNFSGPVPGRPGIEEEEEEDVCLAA